VHEENEEKDRRIDNAYSYNLIGRYQKSKSKISIERIGLQWEIKHLKKE